MSKKTKKNLTKELAFEIDTLDTMLSALVEILEKKGVLTQEEWENMIQHKIEHKTGKSYRNIQLENE